MGSPRPTEEAHNGPLESLLSGGSSQSFWAELNAVRLNHQSLLADVDASSAIISTSISEPNKKGGEMSRGLATFHLPVNVSPLFTLISFYSSPRELFFLFFSPPHCLSSSCFEFISHLLCVCVSFCGSVTLSLSLCVKLRNVCAADPLSVRCGASADRFGV